VSGTWSIASRLCYPASDTAAAKVTTVQLLTHGATLDSTYWDFANGYSYIDAATAAGYATFSYDRLGVGQSAHPDPIQVVQAALQVEILHQLVVLLRASPGLGGKLFKKVVGVGHSAGSTFTQAVSAKYPDDFDAVVLTGITTSMASVSAAQAANCLAIANQQGDRFAGLANGYLTVGSGILGLQSSFFRYPYFDPASKSHICSINNLDFL
jgi:pimeloyl-ACP methyl ester carboxylesterase